jgi:hypothetical protein
MYDINRRSEMCVRNFPHGLKLCTFDTSCTSDVGKSTSVVFTHGMLQLSDHVFRINGPLSASCRSCRAYIVEDRILRNLGEALGHSFISNLSDDRSTASSKTIPPLNAI